MRIAAVTLAKRGIHVTRDRNEFSHMPRQAQLSFMALVSKLATKPEFPDFELFDHKRSETPST